MMRIRWHWHDFRKMPEVPLSWIGGETRDKFSKAISGEYGLEIGNAFFGVFTFYDLERD